MFFRSIIADCARYCKSENRGFAVLQYVITVLLACSFDVLPVSAGEGVADNRVELGILEADVQMGVIGAFGAGFIAQAPIDHGSSAGGSGAFARQGRSGCR